MKPIEPRSNATPLGRPAPSYAKPIESPVGRRIAVTWPAVL